MRDAETGRETELAQLRQVKDTYEIILNSKTWRLKTWIDRNLRRRK